MANRILQTACRRIVSIVIATTLFAVGAPAAQSHWIATWSSPQQVPEPNNALPAHSLDNATLRQLVRISIGGPTLRIRISNVFGKAPLRVDSIHVARAIAPNSSRIDPTSDRKVSFSGESDLVVPAGAEYLSDPIELPVPPLTTIAVSMHFSEQPSDETGHPGSRATSYLLAGNHVGEAELSGATKVEHWYFLAEVDASQPAQSSAVAILGDSITDGHGVATDSNGRWTDVLAQRLIAAKRHIGVLNLGIGGNRVLLDGLGPNALARFERDVVDRPGVKYLIILEGVNDLGTSTHDHPISAVDHRALVQHIIAGYAQMVEKAHDHGIKVIGATIMPYAGSSYYHPDAANEADRQMINAWIRAPKHFDGIVDFDKLMRDPKRPTYLREDYDLGDGLHPSAKGYHAMGEAVPLSLFGRR